LGEKSAIPTVFICKLPSGFRNVPANTLGLPGWVEHIAALGRNLLVKVDVPARPELQLAS
jgi:hypothetical protein